MFLHISATICQTVNVSNAVFHGTHFYVWDMVTYTCQSGYAQTAGNLNRTCQEDGQWDGSKPICKSKSFYYVIMKTKNL